MYGKISTLSSIADILDSRVLTPDAERFLGTCRCLTSLRVLRDLGSSVSSISTDCSDAAPVEVPASNSEFSTMLVSFLIADMCTAGISGEDALIKV